MKNIKKTNENSLINEFIQIFKSEINKKNALKKRLSFVLTGGASPKKLYKALAKAKIDWKNIDLFWGDERFVSKNSNNSNFKLVNNLLLKKINIKKKNIFPFKTNKIKIEISAKKYAKDIKRYFRKKNISFDICLLGMGSDGHVASIFPYSNDLKEKFIVKPILRKDFKRLSLGINIINDSKKIFLWLNSKSKYLIYKKLKSKGKKIPVNNLKKSRLFCFSVYK